jgi:hypothetical protein
MLAGLGLRTQSTTDPVDVLGPASSVTRRRLVGRAGVSIDPLPDLPPVRPLKPDESAGTHGPSLPRWFRRAAADQTLARRACR